MLTRRQFLERTLKGSSLVALGSLVPGFLASTARAAEPGKDAVLIVLEMTGGNDGLNTVAPYADDLYQRARPTLGLKKAEVVKLNDEVGLNPGLQQLQPMWQKGEMAVLQGVGYPNPDRSHFESMDIWHSADPKRVLKSGWIGRGLGSLNVKEGHIPGLHLGKEKLPLAMQGSSTGVPSLHPSKPYELQLGRLDGDERAARQKLIRELTDASGAGDGTLHQFVQRSELQTYTTIDQLKQFARGGGAAYGGYDLAYNLNLIGALIQNGFGTRVFYLAIDGFDTHSNQAQSHPALFQQIAGGVAALFQQLKQGGHDKRVLVMTFSEFGRRVQENGSRGTDHGAASCMFVMGPGVKGGVIGKHPSLKREDLDDGDIKHHTDFRQVYATLLDEWLGCDSQRVLGAKFEHVGLFKKKA